MAKASPLSVGMKWVMTWSTGMFEWGMWIQWAMLWSEDLFRLGLAVELMCAKEQVKVWVLASTLMLVKLESDIL